MDWEKLLLVESMMASGRNEEALSVLTSLLDSTASAREDAVLRMTIAHCLRNLGRSEEARRSLQQVYSTLDKSSETYPRVVYMEALLEEDRGNWSEELKFLDQILYNYNSVLENPDDEDLKAEVLRHRGIALLGLGKYTEAKPLLEAALAEEYDRDLALNYLGQCYFELGKLEEAKQRFREALAVGLRAGHEVSVRYRLGVIHYKLGEYAWALQEFEWCFEHQREQQRVSEDLIRQGLTNTLNALGKNEEANRYSNMGRS